uniref:Uncharacterized protein n=1 Tax=Arundo donax TaxID=35708 RepID=A0A0A9G333_ARUDO
MPVPSMSIHLRIHNCTQTPILYDNNLYQG